MKLVNALRIIWDNQQVKVGTKEGSSYIYIGSKKEFQENLNETSKKIENYLETELTKTVAEYMRRSAGGLTKEVEEKLQEKITYLQMRLDNFIPLRSRKVLEIGTSEACQTITLIIEGDENGKLWTINEARDHGNLHMEGD